MDKLVDTELLVCHHQYYHICPFFNEINQKNDKDGIKITTVPITSKKFEDKKKKIFAIAELISLEEANIIKEYSKNKSKSLLSASIHKKSQYSAYTYKLVKNLVQRINKILTSNLDICILINGAGIFQKMTDLSSLGIINFFSSLSKCTEKGGTQLFKNIWDIPRITHFTISSSKKFFSTRARFQDPIFKTSFQTINLNIGEQEEDEAENKEDPSIYNIQINLRSPALSDKLIAFLEENFKYSQHPDFNRDVVSSLLDYTFDAKDFLYFFDNIISRAIKEFNPHIIVFSYDIPIILDKKNHLKIEAFQRVLYSLCVTSNYKLIFVPFFEKPFSNEEFTDTLYMNENFLYFLYYQDFIKKKEQTLLDDQLRDMPQNLEDFLRRQSKPKYYDQSLQNFNQRKYILEVLTTSSEICRGKEKYHFVNAKLSREVSQIKNTLWYLLAGLFSKIFKRYPSLSFINMKSVSYNDVFSLMISNYLKINQEKAESTLDDITGRKKSNPLSEAKFFQRTFPEKLLNRITLFSSISTEKKSFLLLLKDSENQKFYYNKKTTVKIVESIKEILIVFLNVSYKGKNENFVAVVKKILFEEKNFNRIDVYPLKHQFENQGKDSNIFNEFYVDGFASQTHFVKNEYAKLFIYGGVLKCNSVEAQKGDIINKNLFILTIPEKDKSFKIDKAYWRVLELNVEKIKGISKDYDYELSFFRKFAGLVYKNEVLFIIGGLNFGSKQAWLPTNYLDYIEININDKKVNALTIKRYPKQLQVNFKEKYKFDHLNPKTVSLEPDKPQFLFMDGEYFPLKNKFNSKFQLRNLTQSIARVNGNINNEEVKLDTQDPLQFNHVNIPYLTKGEITIEKTTVPKSKFNNDKTKKYLKLLRYSDDSSSYASSISNNVYIIYCTSSRKGLINEIDSDKMSWESYENVYNKKKKLKNSTIKKIIMEAEKQYSYVYRNTMKFTLEISNAAMTQSKAPVKAEAKNNQSRSQTSDSPQMLTQISVKITSLKSSEQIKHDSQIFSEENNLFRPRSKIYLNQGSDKIFLVHEEISLAMICCNANVNNFDDMNLPPFFNTSMQNLKAHQVFQDNEYLYYLGSGAETNGLSVIYKVQWVDFLFASTERGPTFNRVFMIKEDSCFECNDRTLFVDNQKIYLIGGTKISPVKEKDYTLDVCKSFCINKTSGTGALIDVTNIDPNDEFLLKLNPIEGKAPLVLKISDYIFIIPRFPRRNFIHEGNLINEFNIIIYSIEKEHFNKKFALEVNVENEQNIKFIRADIISKADKTHKTLIITAKRRKSKEEKLLSKSNIEKLHLEIKKKYFLLKVKIDIDFFVTDETSNSESLQAKLVPTNEKYKTKLNLNQVNEEDLLTKLRRSNYITPKNFLYSMNDRMEIKKELLGNNPTGDLEPKK